MDVEYIQPFVEAAIYVFESQLGKAPDRGELAVQKNHFTTEEVTVLIGITGSVEGTVLYGTTRSFVQQLVYKLTGEAQPVFDEMCESAMSEIGNIISGRATMLFEQEGLSCEISPPTMIVGDGTLLSNMDMTRLVIPLEVEFGSMKIAVSFRE